MVVKQITASNADELME